MSTTEAALTVSLFAAMAALQLGGTHAAHASHGRPGAPVFRTAALVDTTGWADSTAEVVQGLAADGLLEDPDTQAMLAMGAAVSSPRK